MTSLQVEQRRAEPAFRSVAIAYRAPVERWLLSNVTSRLAPYPAVWHDIGAGGSSEHARAQDIARSAEERDADLVVMTVEDARLAARRLLTRGTAVVAVPPEWRPGAGSTRVAVGFDGSEPSDAAIEATRALVIARAGSVPHVEIVYVDDCASVATDADAEVVDSRRTTMIEWWLTRVSRQIPGSVEVTRRRGDAVDTLAELSRDCDAVVVGSHGHGRLRRIVERSVSAELIEATQCPLLIVPRSRRDRASRRRPAVVGRRIGPSWLSSPYARPSHPDVLRRYQCWSSSLRSRPTTADVRVAQA